jgi:hypothetical protein
VYRHGRPTAALSTAPTVRLRRIALPARGERQQAEQSAEPADESGGRHLAAIPANAGVVIPANAGVVIPANAGVVIPANAGISPGA